MCVQNQILLCDMDPECDVDPLIPLLSGACLGCLVAHDGGDGPPPIEPCFDSCAYDPARSTDDSPPKTTTIFPGFVRAPGPTDDLSCFAYHGIFPQMKKCTFATYRESHQGGVPLVVYNGTDPSLPMATAIEQANQKMGLQPRADPLPAQADALLSALAARA